MDVTAWWVTTGPLAEGGTKVMGPFENRDLALRVRGYIEKVEGHQNYWVEPEVIS